MSEDIKTTVGKHLDVAERQVISLKEKIKRCDFIGVVDSYALISNALQNASELIPDLDLAIRDKEMKKVLELHDKKHELVKSIPNFCECKTKEPFRFVKEPPKD